MADSGTTRAAAAQELQVYLETERRRINAALDAVLPAASVPPGRLHEAMRHSVFAGGKRLRPLLTLAAGQACGAAPEQVLPVACAVELIHTYSLIHDDLPAFDDEELRRGQPTSHVLFGDAVAILAGDALQALAFRHLAASAHGASHPERWIAATDEIATAAGSTGMCGGQTMDIEAAGGELNLDELRALHAKKTGALLTASVVAGGLLAGADEGAVGALRECGDATGLAFQIVDDLLDIEGDETRLGKRPGGDADRGQPTFPVLVGVEAARHEARELRDRALSALQRFGDRGAPLRRLVAYAVDRSS